MDNMQYEALRRAEAMHQRGTQPPKNQHRGQGKTPEEPPPQTQERQGSAHKDNRDREAPHSSEPKEGLQQRAKNPLEGLWEDKEKLLILLLVMILSSEESSDPTVILALLYLII